MDSTGWMAFSCAAWLAACGLVCGPAAGDTPAAAAGGGEALPLHNVRIPLQYHESGRIRAQFFADQASIPPEGRVSARGVRIEIYADGGELESLITAPECEYNRAGRKVRAESGARIERAELVATAGAMKWDLDEQEMLLYSNVSAAVARDAWAGARRAMGAPPEPWEPGKTAESFGTNRTLMSAAAIQFSPDDGLAILRGNVRVQDPEFLLASDTATVLLRTNQTVRSAILSGNVSLGHGGESATCKKAIFLSGSREIVLLGDAAFAFGEDAVRGGMITYGLDGQQLECENAEIVVSPRTAGGGGFPAGIQWPFPGGRREDRDG